MRILGIESSCDECSAAIVEDGKKIISHVIATQLEEHKVFYGVVPEIASRVHTEWIYGVVEQAFIKVNEADDTSMPCFSMEEELKKIDAIAVVTEPGLVGSLMVGLSFAKGLAYSLKKPLIPVNHVQAHLYASQLEFDISYPFIGLLVSGGHTLISIVKSPHEWEILGTTIDDACGEAFDKVAKYYDLGFPGGLAIDQLAQSGDAFAYHFPKPKLKHESEFNVSYSGLKTSVIHQAHQFHKKKDDSEAGINLSDLAASFQRVAISILLEKALLACERYQIDTLVAGGGVAANSYLRQSLEAQKHLKVYYPSLKLCTDNAAMIAGLGFHNFQRGDVAPWNMTVSPRSTGLHKAKPKR